MTTLTVDRNDVLVINHVNATNGYSYSEYDVPIRDFYFAEAVLPEGSDGIVCDSDLTEWTVNRGDIYRHCTGEFGRCISKVYRDMPDGPPKTVGWCFVKRQQYDDSNDTYLCETWVSFAKVNPKYTFT